MTERELYQRLLTGFENGIRAGRNTKAKEWLIKTKINPFKTGIGFHSGQIHHRKSEEFKDQLDKIGLISKNGFLNRYQQPAYDNLCTNSISFSLRDQEDEVVNFFFQYYKGERSRYLNEKGVYPEYPNRQTKRLYLTQDEVSAATILTAGILKNEDAVIALRKGEFTQDIEEAIESIFDLKEIVIIE